MGAVPFRAAYQPQPSASKMKLLVIACLFLSAMAEPEPQHETAGFVTHLNGAVVPIDTTGVLQQKALHGAAHATAAFNGFKFPFYVRPAVAPVVKAVEPTVKAVEPTVKAVEPTKVVPYIYPFTYGLQYPSTYYPFTYGLQYPSTYGLPPSPFGCRQVALKVYYNGKYVGHGAPDIAHASSTDIDEDRGPRTSYFGYWHTFAVGSDKVAFRSYYDGYLFALPTGDVIANRRKGAFDANYLNDWETFTFREVEPGYFTFKSYHGKYLVAEDNGDLKANVNVANTRAIFQVICHPNPHDNARG